MKSRYADPGFWIEAADRAIKTSAASMVAVIGTNVLRVTDVDWFGLLNVGALAIILSLLTSVASAPGRKNS